MNLALFFMFDIYGVVENGVLKKKKKVNNCAAVALYF